MIKFAFPETMAIGSRLTPKDYMCFRRLVELRGFTMFRAIRLLVGWWLIGEGAARRLNYDFMSSRLKSAVFREFQSDNCLFRPEMLELLRPLICADTKSIPEGIRQTVERALLDSGAGEIESL